jgi:hypothetical protein
MSSDTPFSSLLEMEHDPSSGRHNYGVELILPDPRLFLAEMLPGPPMVFEPPPMFTEEQVMILRGEFNKEPDETRDA